jgi:hypothetical protein
MKAESVPIIFMLFRKLCRPWCLLEEVCASDGLRIVCLALHTVSLRGRPVM